MHLSNRDAFLVVAMPEEGRSVIMASLGAVMRRYPDTFTADGCWVIIEDLMDAADAAHAEGKHENARDVYDEILANLKRDHPLAVNAKLRYQRVLEE